MGVVMRTWTLADVMNREVLTVRESKTVEELADFLGEKEISGVPVVDRRGKLVGVVSVTDIAGEAETGSGRDRSSKEPLRVRDIMTPTVFTVPEETTIREVARTMIAGRVHRLLVTRDGHVVGIVTPLDLLKVLSEGEL